jgi:hypothetical protein
MLAVAVFIVAVLGWVLLRRRADASVDASRRDRQRAAVLRIGAAHDLHVEGDAASGEVLGIAVRVEAGTRGMLFDGDVVLSTPCSSDIRLVAWPREPPDEVTDGLGRELTTGDEVFDSRFAVFASSPNVIDALTADTRRELVDFVTTATCVRDGVAMLLLPGIPSDRAFLELVRLMGRISHDCGALGSTSSPARAPPPYA